MANSISYNFLAQGKQALLDLDHTHFLLDDFKVTRASGSWRFNRVTSLFEPIKNNELETGGYLSPGFTNVLHSSADVANTSPWYFPISTPTTSSVASIFQGHSALNVTLDANFNYVQQNITTSIASGTDVFCSSIVELPSPATVTLSVLDQTSGEIVHVTYNPATNECSGTTGSQFGFVQVMPVGPNSSKVVRLFLKATLPNAISSSNYLGTRLTANSTGTGQTFTIHSINGYLSGLGPPIATASSNDVYPATTIQSAPIKGVRDEGTLLLDFSPYTFGASSSQIAGLYPSSAFSTSAGSLAVSLTDALALSVTDTSGAATTLTSPANIIPGRRVRVAVTYSTSSNTVNMIDSISNSFVSAKVSLATGMNFMDIGGGGLSQAFNGQIHQIRYLPYKASYPELYEIVSKNTHRAYAYEA